jgi:hypothetical protein
MERHRLAGKTVRVCLKVTTIDPWHLHGQLMTVEDWWINVTGKSWMEASGIPVAIQYGLRSGLSGLPTDNQVVYGKIGGLGYLLHDTELEEQP